MQKRIWILLLSGLVTSLCAFATTATDTFWQIAGTGGSYTYTGGSAVLTGTGIEVDSVQDANLSSPFGTLYYVIGNDNGFANLTFTSGASNGSWSWSGGAPGSLSVVGCISTDDVNCITGETKTTTLVSDEFTSVGIAPIGGTNGFVFAGLQGSLDAAAATLLGVSQSFTSPASQMSDKVTGLTSYGSAFSGVSSTATGGNLDLYAAPEDWSLSSSLGIFAFALVVFGVARRLGLIKAVVF